LSLLREVEFTDLEGVRALTVAVGWGAPSAQDWQHLWVENPAMRGPGAKLTKGWVLEQNGGLVGFLCNLAQTYTLNGRSLRAAVATALVVRPDFRGEGLKLVMAYVRQGNVDLLLNTTAGPETAKIFEYLKFAPLPQSGYQRSFYWVLHSRPFVTSALLKISAPPIASIVAGGLLAPVFAALNRIRVRRPRGNLGSPKIQVLRGDAIGPEFDDLWRSKSEQSEVLWAVRDSTALRWHFTAHGRAHAPMILCAHDNRRLMGYIAITRQDTSHLKLNRARVADLFVVDDDAATIERLLGAACDVASAGGASMLEAIGFPERIQRVFQASRPYQLWNHAIPFWYKASDPELHRTLADPSHWYACLYDGDGAL
jgi:hypothetical protein